MLLTKIVAFSFALAGVQAAPVHEAASLDARAPVPSNFYAHAVAAIKAYGAGATKTMMHSGVGASKAFQIAKTKKLQTVETTIFTAISKDKTGVYKDTLKKYCVTKDKYCAHGEEKEWVEAWELISKAWAEYADAQTTLATTAAGPNSQSFYKRVEEPILNKDGVKITVDATYPAGS